MSHLAVKNMIRFGLTSTLGDIGLNISGNFNKKMRELKHVYIGIIGY